MEEHQGDNLLGSFVLFHSYPGGYTLILFSEYLLMRRLKKRKREKIIEKRKETKVKTSYYFVF